MFLPDNIDFAESKKYILSIRLLPSGFYFSIHCPTDETAFYQNTVIFNAHSDYLKNIEKLIFDYSFFSYNYKKINVFCVENETSIVPNEFYNKKLESDFLSFNYLDTKPYVTSNELPDHNSRVVWALDKSVHSFLSRALLHPNFISHLSFLVTFFYKKHNKDESALFVNFNDDKMIDMVAFRADKLILAKTFHVNNPLEDSYYIQKMWETLQLNAQLDKLYFSGKTSNHSDCINTLMKVISKTENLSFKLPNDIKANKEEIPTEILKQLCEL